MVVKKGLSKAFTREVISEDTLAPSEFKVTPIKLSRSYADSPIEEIQKYKQMESSFEEDRAAEERLRKARIPTESILDREKLDRVVKRLNMLKKMRLEQERQQAAAQVQAQKAAQAQAQAQNAKPVSPPAPPIEKAPSSPKEEMPAKKQENSPPTNKAGFIQKLNFFRNQKPEQERRQAAAQVQKVNPVSKPSEKVSATNSNVAAPNKPQANNPPINKGNEPKKQDPSMKTKKDNSLKEPSF